MTPSTAWFHGLQRFVADRRLTEPLPQPLAAAQEAAERSIIASSLVATLAEAEAVREARRATDRATAAAATVVTTSPVGIVAAEELVASTPALAALVGERFVAVTELEYRLWCIRSPDDAFLYHVNVWNWIKTRVPQQRQSEFADFPLGDGEVYWLHREGRAGASGLDRRACHLWKWNGRHAALLKATVTERGVGSLGAAHEGS